MDFDFDLEGEDTIGIGLGIVGVIIFFIVSGNVPGVNPIFKVIGAIVTFGACYAVLKVMANR